MDPTSLDHVLSCPSLPSLPGVAIRMLELMHQPRTSADQIAQVIQNDPALATKVLRTVNSSYYGLSKPCPAIKPAVAFLGLNTVKTLTLGLSLVDLGRTAGEGFDLATYWRRAVYSAAAARIIAKLAKTCDPDEAFVAALLQDFGMLACFSALGAAYTSVAGSARQDHHQLPEIERKELGFDHAEVGARIAERWHLPAQIVACTRFHHRPERAPEAHASLVRVIVTSADAASALTPGMPHSSLPGFRTKMREWFNADEATSDEVLHQTGAAAKELSKLLDLDTGRAPDVGAILSEVGEEFLHHQVDMQRTQHELTAQTVTDALTGAANRKHFDGEVERAFDDARTSGRPLAILFADADRFKSVNDTLGHQAGDAVLIQVSRRMRDTTGDSGTVCRYGGEEFAVILPGIGPGPARELAEAIRRAVEQTPIDVSNLKLVTTEVHQTISVGVACLQSGGHPYESAESLVHAADEAVYAAKKAGRNRIWCKDVEPAPPLAAAPAPVDRRASPPPNPARPTTLIVEGDALAAKMLEVLLTKHAQFHTVVARSAEEALMLLRGAGVAPPLRPALVLVEVSLPAMSGLDLVRLCRSSPDLRHLCIVVMSARTSAKLQQEAIAAGAAAYVDKAALCADLAGTVRRLLELAQGLAKAA